MTDVIIDHQSSQDVKSCRNWVLSFLGVKKTKPTEAKKFTRACTLTWKIPWTEEPMGS